MIVVNPHPKVYKFKIVKLSKKMQYTLTVLSYLINIYVVDYFYTIKTVLVHILLLETWGWPLPQLCPPAWD